MRDLLNPACPESEDFGEDLLITLAEVTEVVKKPGVDEIRPEMLKARGMMGLSRLTHLCNVGLGQQSVRLHECHLVGLMAKLQ